MERMEKRTDLTQGGILAKLLVIAVPIMGTQLLQMAYNLVDVFFLGRVGADAVAASGTSGMYMWLAMGPMLIGRTGAEICVSQSLGARDAPDAEQYARGALALSLGLGLLVGLAMVLLRGPLIAFFAIREAHVVRDSEVYLAIVGAAMPLAFLCSAAVGVYNASGDAKTPFLINGLGLVFNMALDPLLIFGCHMGVAGAALATSIAQAVVAVAMLWALKRSPRRPIQTLRFRGAVSRAHCLRMTRLSLPVAMESMLFTLFAMITSRFVATYGAGALAAVKIGSQVESLSWMIAGGFGTAVTAFVGQNYGAGCRERIDRGVRLSAAAMMLWGLAVTVVLYVFAEPLFLLFLPDPSLLVFAVPYLRIIAVCEVAGCLEGVYAGAFRGTGRTVQPAVSSIASNALRVALAFGLMQTSLGINGIFWAISLTATLRGFGITLWYLLSKRGRRKNEPKTAARSSAPTPS